MSFRMNTNNILMYKVKNCIQLAALFSSHICILVYEIILGTNRVLFGNIILLFLGYHDAEICQVS